MINGKTLEEALKSLRVVKISFYALGNMIKNYKAKLHFDLINKFIPFQILES
jgi:hypothetical protein